VIAVASADKARRPGRSADRRGDRTHIVFTRTKHGADAVVKPPDQAGIAAAAIHGNKSLSQRPAPSAAFKSGESESWSPTDMRGARHRHRRVSHVVNFELPNVPEVYRSPHGGQRPRGRFGRGDHLCDPGGGARGLLRDIEKLIARTLLHDGGAPAAVQKKTRPAQPGPQKPASARRRRRKSSPRTLPNAA
jgi:ATP-dependent RNA helicase RhlE